MKEKEVLLWKELIYCREYIFETRVCLSGRTSSHSHVEEEAEHCMFTMKASEDYMYA